MPTPNALLSKIKIKTLGLYCIKANFLFMKKIFEPQPFKSWPGFDLMKKSERKNKLESKDIIHIPRIVADKPYIFTALINHREFYARFKRTTIPNTHSSA